MKRKSGKFNFLTIGSPELDMIGGLTNYSLLKIMIMKTEVTVLRVERQPEKPFSIRKKSGGWLCANTADRNKWHYANTFSTGVTEYATLEDAEEVCSTLKGHEIVEFKA